MSDCTSSHCEKPARAAVKVTNGQKLYFTVYADDREAPKNAEPYCQEHTLHLVQELTKALVDGDD